MNLPTTTVAIRDRLAREGYPSDQEIRRSAAEGLNRTLLLFQSYERNGTLGRAAAFDKKARGFRKGCFAGSFHGWFGANLMEVLAELHRIEQVPGILFYLAKDTAMQLAGTPEKGRPFDCSRCAGLVPQDAAFDFAQIVSEALRRTARFEDRRRLVRRTMEILEAEAALDAEAKAAPASSFRVIVPAGLLSDHLGKGHRKGALLFLQ